jgi:hypothetical protein
MTEELKKKIAQFKPIVDRLSHYRIGKGRLFGCCLRASFARAFEFVEIAASRKEADDAFFLVPALRGITEDVIYLRFMSRLSADQRDVLATNLMQLELSDKLRKQEAFFRVMRPFQPVLSSSGSSTAEIEEQVREIWRANGWPGLQKTNPPTREIAQKSDPGLLEVVYDYIYRLTSGVVHFNPQVLLRSGWGNTGSAFRFSTRNMAPYYLAFAQIYGCYLFCLYFEFFGGMLRVGKATAENVSQLREYLLMQSRWPEMVTFEEMNVKVPEGTVVPGLVLRAAYTVMLRDGFIRTARGEHTYNKRLQATRSKQCAPEA